MLQATPEAAQAGADTPAARLGPRTTGGRIVGRNAFEAELAHRSAALDKDGAADFDGGFTLLLLRLKRSDRRVKLLATEGADHVLREVLQRVAAVLQDHDLVTACSRDEVAILLASVTQEGVARLAADRLFRSLARMGNGASMRPQLGVAVAPAAGRSVEQLLSAVDVACAAAATAHPRVVIATAAMADHDDESLLPALQEMLETNALTLAFQPQYDLVRGTWTTVEALIRWPRGRSGPVLTPERLVDLAERHGLMDALTALVLNTAMRQVVDLDRLGAKLDVAVNLSPSMMADAALPDRVAQALAIWDLQPGRLVLEVTENAMIREAEATMAVMRRLAALGARLSIDDFGTGHSSFARLRDMPLGELKIDRLFVANMTARREDLQIVRSIIDVAHNFELRAVAEGVEDGAIFAMLRAMGCDAVQGYHCAMPMSADELRRWWPDRPRGGQKGSAATAK